jgi:hypothetical protein
MKNTYFKMATLSILALFIVCVANAQTPENVARHFCTAVFTKNMVKAKSFMTEDGARRTPSKMSLSDDECKNLLGLLNKATAKVIKSEYSTSIVTVRFYDTNNDKARWFCCSVELVNENGRWKITTYGY